MSNNYSPFRLFTSSLFMLSVLAQSAVAQDVYVNTENDAVRRYNSEVHYASMSDDSHVAEYYVPGGERADFPVAATIGVRHTDGDSLTLLVADDRTFSHPVTVGISGSDDVVSVDNLTPHRTYYYKVMSLADTVVSQGHVFTSGQVRCIHVSTGGFNIRDMGGWPTADGRIIGYGRLYRGSELNGAYVADSLSLAQLRQIGIGAEIDLRYTGENAGAGTSAFGFTDDDFLYTDNLSIQTYSFTYSSFTSRMRSILQFINSHLQQQQAVYMHCVWGIDRTGLVAMLLGGLLGADYDALMKDYELSYFVGSNKDKSRRDDVIRYINSMPGTTLQQRFNSFFTDIVQVSQDDIDLFRQLMLDDAPVTTTYSATLPVVFITCEDSINSKEIYRDGTYAIVDDPSALQPSSYTLQPSALQIRGRGNWTWYGSFEKKPYKLKLDKGEPLLGMGSNKHWALLAHADGGQEAYFRNTAGFELGRLIGLPFTPSQQPVEVVLNGEYQGLYFLTETVRTGKQRVNITEQADGETDPELVSGAWLVEIDNYDEPEHQVLPPLDGTGLTLFRVTWHSPENLSTEQYDYLLNEWTEILQAVYDPDKTSTLWEQHFDLNQLARYYLVGEMLDHVEAFLGSCFLYKDQGEAKWHMGPLWDIGHAFNNWHPKNTYIWEYKHETEDDWEPCILEELVKFPALMDIVHDVWMTESDAMYSALISSLQQFAQLIGTATVNDRQRWPKYGTPDVEASLSGCLDLLEQKRQFLTDEWGVPDVITALHPSSSTLHPSPSTLHQVYTLQGQSVKGTLQPGVYISQGRKIVVRH